MTDSAWVLVAFLFFEVLDLYCISMRNLSCVLLSPVEVSSLFEAMVLNSVPVGEVGVGVWTISSSSGVSVT